MSPGNTGAVVVGVLAFVVVWVCVAGFIGYLNGLERAAECAATIRPVPVERWHGGVPPPVKCP